MNKIVILFTVFSLFTLSSYSQKVGGVKNINVKYTPGAGDISSLIKAYEVLPLDANPEANVKNPCRVIFTDSLILIMDGTQNKIMILNRKGKFINAIAKKGRGPGEYNYIDDFFFNSVDRVVNIVERDKIKSYNIKGEFVKEVSLGFNPMRISFLNSDSYIIEKGIPVDNPEYDYYIRLTNKSFKTKSSRLPLKQLTGTGFGIEGQIYRTIVTGKNAYFFSYTGDTVYHINNERILPAFAINYDKKTTIIRDGTNNPKVDETYRYLSYFELQELNMLFYTFRKENFCHVFNPGNLSAKTYKTPFVLKGVADGKGVLLTNSISLGKLIELFDPGK